MQAQWLKPRKVAKRIVISGLLQLETPTHLGNGDVDGPLDMPLHLDPLEGKALLTGASLAGALRNYLSIYLRDSDAKDLFGYVDGNRSIESRVIIDDALATGNFSTELRDGVAIQPETRTAKKDMKFDIELLAAGTEFPIRIELNLPADEAKAKTLKQTLGWALDALGRGDIALGKRKRRGFGKVKVARWQVDEYDLTTSAGLKSWLQTPVEVQTPDSQRNDDLLAKLGVDKPLETPIAKLTATFRIDGSLLIRSAVGDAAGPDFEHLKSERAGKGMAPVLSGTSVAGAMRARALRIANTLGMNGDAIADDLFGYRPKDRKDKTPMTASRIWVEETVIERPLELVHTRVAIDRFTGGAYPGALFSEQPLFGTPETQVEIRCWIPNPREWEIGLLLLLLKDLWTGDLPLGGESSIGRGRLQGLEATLTVKDKQWTIKRKENADSAEEDSDQLEFAGDPIAELENYLQYFLTYGKPMESES